MSKPLILDLLERVKELEEKIKTKQNKEWKSQDVNLGLGASITIEDIKNASEVQVYSVGINNVEVNLYFTKADSGKWLHASYVEWDNTTNHHAISTVDFNTGFVQNGGSRDTSTTIKKISWR